MAHDPVEKTASPARETKTFKAPDTFVILFFVALIAWAATWLLPAGKFAESDGSIAVSSFEWTGRQGAPVFGLGDNVGFLNFLFEGLVTGDRYSSTVGLLAFLLIIGGAFGIILRTGAMEAGIRSLIARPSARGDALMPLLFALFSLGGAIFGMGEEAVVFVLILVPAFARAGYDAITVLLVTYVGTQIGFATSWMNPFSVIVAQGIAGLDVMSGALLRVIMWSLFTGLGAFLTWRYARHVRLHPSASLVAHLRKSDVDRADQSGSDETFRLGHALVLLTLLIGMGWVAWGVAFHKYYFPELAAQFFTIGLIAAGTAVIFRLNGTDMNACGKAFADGAMQMAPVGLIIAFAKGIVLLLGGDDPSEPSLLNSALYVMASGAQGLSDSVAGVAMLGLQAVINLFVVSGSGQAALTMPLMAPLSDLVGLERQTAVLSFQLGDGLMNLIVPSSGALMGCLAAARVDWAVWLKFFWKWLLAALALGAVFVVVAVQIGYS